LFFISLPHPPTPTCHWSPLFVPVSLRTSSCRRFSRWSSRKPVLCHYLMCDPPCVRISPEAHCAGGPAPPLRCDGASPLCSSVLRFDFCCISPWEVPFRKAKAEPCAFHIPLKSLSQQSSHSWSPVFYFFVFFSPFASSPTLFCLFINWRCLFRLFVLLLCVCIRHIQKPSGSRFLVFVFVCIFAWTGPRLRKSIANVSFAWVPRWGYVQPHRVVASLHAFSALVFYVEKSAFSLGHPGFCVFFVSRTVIFSALHSTP